MGAHIHSVRPGCGGAQLSSQAEGGGGRIEEVPIPLKLGVSEAGAQEQPYPAWPRVDDGQLSVCPVRSRYAGREARGKWVSMPAVHLSNGLRFSGAPYRTICLTSTLWVASWDWLCSTDTT